MYPRVTCSCRWDDCPEFPWASALTAAIAHVAPSPNFEPPAAKIEPCPPFRARRHAATSLYTSYYVSSNPKKKGPWETDQSDVKNSTSGSARFVLNASSTVTRLMHTSDVLMQSALISRLEHLASYSGLAIGREGSMACGRDATLIFPLQQAIDKGPTPSAPAPRPRRRRDKLHCGTHHYHIAKLPVALL